MTMRPSPEPRSYTTSSRFTRARRSIAVTASFGVGTKPTSGARVASGASAATATLINAAAAAVLSDRIGGGFVPVPEQISRARPSSPECSAARSMPSIVRMRKSHLVGAGPPVCWEAAGLGFQRSISDRRPAVSGQKRNAKRGFEMSLNIHELCLAATVAGALLAWAPSAEARVTKIIIGTKTSPAFGGESYGAAGQYETLAGRAFGELDPRDAHNAIIQDIDLAPTNARGKVEYMATFLLVKPVDMSKASGLMWHDVPNRGGRITINAGLRVSGDVRLSSGWQGDNSGGSAYGSPNRDYVVVPIAHNRDGSPITGKVLGRIVNRSGVNSQPSLVQGNPVPYKPASLDTNQASMTTHASETIEGVVSGINTIPSTDWAWATCSTTNPFPGTPDPTQICLKNGFDPALLYQVVFTAKDPYVLGVGFAALRDVASFFKNENKDDEGAPSPVARRMYWDITRAS